MIRRGYFMVAVRRRPTARNGSALIMLSCCADGWALGRFRSDSAWSTERCALLRSASLRSKLPRSRLLHTQIPCHSMASATFRNPAMLAPAWILPFMPYRSAAAEQAA